MQNFESMEDALRVAREVLAGDVDPNLGCGLIAEIGRKLKYPSDLSAFLLLDHDQSGHEGLGITAEGCVPEILDACRELLARPV